MLPLWICRVFKNSLQSRLEYWFGPTLFFVSSPSCMPSIHTTGNMACQEFKLSNWRKIWMMNCACNSERLNNHSSDIVRRLDRPQVKMHRKSLRQLCRTKYWLKFDSITTSCLLLLISHWGSLNRLASWEWYLTRAPGGDACDKLMYRTSIIRWSVH
jgi:hypothetical protein